MSGDGGGAFLTEIAIADSRLLDRELESMLSVQDSLSTCESVT